MAKKTKKADDGPTRGQILERNWSHKSTDDLNREIARCATTAAQAEEDARRLTAELTAARKSATTNRADCKSLERIIEKRR